MTILGPGIKKDDFQAIFKRIRASWGNLELRGRGAGLADCTFLKRRIQGLEGGHVSY